ncbi:hypothetical protein PF008_g27488 [Phytophthora fragariae]|uniref:Uncharacterized protein n=1 Tax=Phytophthora fragariae TaxID=53985 RepID=A0A6G0QE19_9STRA|nr:hypothetical protein PF008_g27488 [Phytophthora fragariae]
MLSLVPIVALALIPRGARNATYSTINESDASINWTTSYTSRSTVRHTPRLRVDAAL